VPLLVLVTGGCAHVASPAGRVIVPASPRPDGLYAGRQHFRQTRQDAALETDPKYALEYAFEYALEYGLTCALEDVLQSPLDEVLNDPLECGLKSSLVDALGWGLRYMLEDGPKDAPREAMDFARRQAIDSARVRIIEAALDDALKKVEAEDPVKAAVKEALSKALNAAIEESFGAAFETALNGGPGEAISDGMFACPLNHPDQYISSGFGFRGRTRGGAGHLHAGVDIVVPTGTPIMAAAAGTVSFAGSKGNGYGLIVKVDHGNGFETWYAHLSAFHVDQGDQVGGGDQIAEAGRSGNATTSHLHYEVHKDGEAIDPEPYLP